MAGDIKRVIMGLDRMRRTPCGFCFVEYHERGGAQNAINFVNGTKLDNRIIRTDWDVGFKEGRQYGRGRGGGQVCLNCNKCKKQTCNNEFHHTHRFVMNIEVIMMKREEVMVVVYLVLCNNNIQQEMKERKKHFHLFLKLNMTWKFNYYLFILKYAPPTLSRLDCVLHLAPL